MPPPPLWTHDEANPYNTHREQKRKWRNGLCADFLFLSLPSLLFHTIQTRMAFSFSFCYWKYSPGTSPVALCLRLCVSSAEGVGSIPDRGTKISHAAGCGDKVKKKEDEEKK